MRVLTWNLFHGRATPSAGRSLLNEFCAALDGWAWDVALLQEVPPWWPPLLGRACGASAWSAPTSRNGLLCLRRAIASRAPDLLGSWGGGANAVLVRGAAVVHEHRSVELTRLPERRVAHGVRLDAGWVVNLHASLRPKGRTRADVARAFASFDGAVVVGGDFNLRAPEAPAAWKRVASHRVDHVFARGAGAEAAVLDAGVLSDHRPLVVRVDVR